MPATGEGDKKMDPYKKLKSIPFVAAGIMGYAAHTTKFVQDNEPLYKEKNDDLIDKAELTALADNLKATVTGNRLADKIHNENFKVRKYMFNYAIGHFDDYDFNNDGRLNITQDFEKSELMDAFIVSLMLKAPEIILKSP
jgi:hypothetical protein